VYAIRPHLLSLIYFLSLPVHIEKKPQDIDIMEGETATLSCTTSDLITPVTWRRNNMPLLNGDKYETRKKGKLNLLLIHETEPEDSGIYSCDTGDMQSDANLTVNGKDIKQHCLSVP
jgi:hypothetical protein